MCIFTNIVFHTVVYSTTYNLDHKFARYIPFVALGLETLQLLLLLAPNYATYSM
jgi:hypothetical protein